MYPFTPSTLSLYKWSRIRYIPVLAMLAARLFMDGSFDQSITSDISGTIGWIAMTFCRDIHVSQIVCPTDFGCLMTFPLAPPAG